MSFDTPLDYRFDITYAPSKKKIDTRVKYYRNARSKTIHKETCELLSATAPNQWMWATGREPIVIVRECSTNAYGLTPCTHCFKEELKEFNGQDCD